jgi:hypothetical protein
MTTFLVALVVFAVAFAAMAVGLLGRRCLRGTCGGVANKCHCTGPSTRDAHHDRSSDCGEST